MTILSELHQDHVNLNKLLVILKLKVEALRRGAEPNFNLVADAIDYIVSYADAYHHPREDELYLYYQGRSEELDKQLSLCSAEHLALKLATSELQEAIESVLQGAVRPMNDISDLLEGFLEMQSGHLNAEEGVLFPLIECVATDEDWKQLKDRLPSRPDPLFGEQRANDYTALYKELMLDMNAA